MVAGCEGIGGEDISKRSPILLVLAGGDLVVVIGDALEEKSPQSPPKLSFRAAVAVTGAGAFVSKNDPPLSADRETLGADGTVGDARLEKGLERT